MSTDCHSMQLIDEAAQLQVRDLDDFIKKTNLSDCGYSYSIVSIIGPQSSGKSTLINNLFETKFKMMDSDELSQTTKGIWMAKCINIKPFTIVMDIEGADGRERKDDTSFEKRSALFAFAVSDIVMINMDWKDVGKMHGGCKHLLKTVFQHMARHFGPHKTTLLFVLRDKATLSSKLESGVVADMTEIWDEAIEGTAREQTPISDYFNMEVKSLAHYKDEQFKIQVEKLRERFFKPIAPRSRPALGFSYDLKEIWKIIQADEELQLPAHEELVSTHVFGKVADEELKSFSLDIDKLLKGASQSDQQRFGQTVSSIRDKYLKKYDTRTNFMKAKPEMRQKLQSDMSKIVQPFVQKLLHQLYSTALEESKEKIEVAIKKGKATESVITECLVSFTKSSEGLIYEKDRDSFSKTKSQLEKDLRSHQREFSAIRKEKLLKESLLAVGAGLAGAGVGTAVGLAGVAAAPVVGGLIAANPHAVHIVLPTCARLLGRMLG